MPKLIIYLRNQDLHALANLAEQEYRVPKAQAALIIRQELERRGLVQITSILNIEEDGNQYEQSCTS